MAASLAWVWNSDQLSEATTSVVRAVGRHRIASGQPWRVRPNSTPTAISRSRAKAQPKQSWTASRGDSGIPMPPQMRRPSWYAKACAKCGRVPPDRGGPTIRAYATGPQPLGWTAP